MSAPLGAAVVGLGVGEQHARALARGPDSSLRWVSDHDEERMTRLVAELTATSPAKDFGQILGDPQTSVVALASYDDDHAAQVIDSLRAGKHVFCEKPLCVTRAELDGIVAEWRRAPKHLGCNLVLRAAPLFIWLREAIARGELGDIYAFDGEYLYGRLHKITEGWRSKVKDYSVTAGGGVHMVDLMLWLTGQRPNRVAAVGNHIVTTGTAFQGDDYVSATFGFESGLIGRITSNFGCVHRHQHVVRIFGTRATFLLDDRGPRLYRSRDPEEQAEELSLAAKHASKAALIPGFLRRICEGIDPRGSAAHEFGLMTATLAVDDALRAGAPQPIEYPT